jgi:hypothetical protein
MGRAIPDREERPARAAKTYRRIAGFPELLTTHGHATPAIGAPLVLAGF